MSTGTGTAKRTPPRGPPIEWTLIQSANRDYLWAHNNDTTHTAPIEGGWLVRFRHYEGEASRMSTQSITFVPDPEHRWDPKAQGAPWEPLGGVVNAAYNDQTARMRVHGGWVYKNHFATRGRTLTIALVFVPGEPAEPPPEVSAAEEPDQPQPQPKDSALDDEPLHI